MMAELFGLGVQVVTSLWGVIQRATSAREEDQQAVIVRLKDWISQLEAASMALDQRLAANDAAADKALDDAAKK